jgi:hypothetical protein
MGGVRWYPTMSELGSLLSNCHKYHTPRKPVSSKIKAQVEKLLSGEWTVEDILEMAVDEVTTSAAVGTGPDKAMGSTPNVPATNKVNGAFVKTLSRHLTRFITKNPHLDVDRAAYLWFAQRPELVGLYKKPVLSHLKQRGF